MSERQQEESFNDREQKKSSQPRSRSRSPKRRSRSRSRSRSYSRSRSRSRGHRSRSRSRDRRRSHSRGRRHRSHSTSPFSNRRRHQGNRDDPEENACIGVFGLSLYTTDKDLREVFGRYGPLDSINVVHDHQTGRSRGFAFVTYETLEDAREAKDKTNGMEIDGRRIRVDFSITKRPHTPTPGIYMGKPTRPRRSGDYRRSPSPDYRRRSPSPDYRRRRSPSPYYRRGGYSRSRSRSPRDYRRY